MLTRAASAVSCSIAALGVGYPRPHRMSWAAFRFRRGWGRAAVSLGVFEGTREATRALHFLWERVFCWEFSIYCRPGLTRVIHPGVVRTQGPPGRPVRGRGWAAFSPELLQAPSLPGLPPPQPPGEGSPARGGPGGLKVRLPAASFQSCSPGRRPLSVASSRIHGASARPTRVLHKRQP